MSDLTKALDDYKMAFQKKLDAYVIPDFPVLPPIEKKEHPLPKPKSPITFEPIGGDVVLANESNQSSPSKKQDKKSVPIPREKQNLPSKPLHEPARASGNKVKPPPPIVKSHHIIHNVIKSLVFRFTVGLIILLLL